MPVTAMFNHDINISQISMVNRLNLMFFVAVKTITIVLLFRMLSNRKN